jgi:hypothetical protein
MKSEILFPTVKCPGMPIKNPVLASKLASKESENTFTLVTIIIELVVIISFSLL